MDNSLILNYNKYQEIKIWKITNILINHSIEKYKISNMGVLNFNTLLITKINLSTKKFSSKNNKLKLLCHILILACLDLF